MATHGFGLHFDCLGRSQSVVGRISPRGDMGVGYTQSHGRPLSFDPFCCLTAGDRHLPFLEHRGGAQRSANESEQQELQNLLILPRGEDT